jgi:hypothetical protein
MRRTVAIGTTKIRHLGRPKKKSEGTLLVLPGGTTDQRAKVKMRIKEEIVDMPSGMAIPLEVQRMVPPHPCKSPWSVCGANISIPSAKKFSFSQRSNGKRTSTTLKKEEIDPFRKRFPAGVAVLPQCASLLRAGLEIRAQDRVIPPANGKGLGSISSTHGYLLREDHIYQMILQ